MSSPKSLQIIIIITYVSGTALNALHMLFQLMTVTLYMLYAINMTLSCPYFFADKKTKIWELERRDVAMASQ